jgi:cytochrome c553
MSIPATAVAPEFLGQLARHFAAMPRAPQPQPTPGDAGLQAKGETIARNGLPELDVPACLGCHGRPDRNPLYPEIAGQPEEYIAAQLRLFRAGKRGGTRYWHLMRNAAGNLSDDDIAALAAYFAQMPPTAATGTR